MDRCALAYELHQAGNNCAQAVAGAFSDLTGFSREQVMSAAAGFGGGVGRSHAELCGSISGGVLALGLIFPNDRQKAYTLSKEFRRRFEAVFGRTICGELLEAHPAISDKTPAAQRLKAPTHCRVMVVTAAELLEGLLQEEKVLS